MARTQVDEALIRREVDSLFATIKAKRGDLCTNPVTGGDFVYGFDPIKQQKDLAYKRLLVREYLALNGPPDAPPIPTDDYHHNRAKYTDGLLGFITAYFAWSLEAQKDLEPHPSFEDFAAGLLWQDENNVELCSLPLVFPPEQFIELKRRFPPRKLEGLKRFRWYSPQSQKVPKKSRRAA